ncbi:MAG: 2-C-methyl-D-erythritol 2,4-cyclodiphosphate synthase [Crocinitomicaceae bacterium]|nr:2-C-methyl-D-erythritol 2,4-cyclodiphosphate synthase [Crocinitomicaceae bacterium]
MDIRIGYGVDIHRLENGSSLRLGGIDIPSPYSTIGHSDADALIHAICDAILGALNKRDIGFHFPDTDPEYKSKDSRFFLEKIEGLMKQNGYELINLDSTVIIDSPKLQKFIPEMIDSISRVLNTSAENISIKATTAEGLGPIGENKAIEVRVVALLKRISD